mgnify:CR=1 FL=1
MVGTTVGAAVVGADVVGAAVVGAATVEAAVVGITIGWSADWQPDKPTTTIAIQIKLQRILSPLSKIRVRWDTFGHQQQAAVCITAQACKKNLQRI